MPKLQMLPGGQKKNDGWVGRFKVLGFKVRTNMVKIPIMGSRAVYPIYALFWVSGFGCQCSAQPCLKSDQFDRRRN